MVTIAARQNAANSWHIAKVGTRSFNICILGGYDGITIKYKSQQCYVILQINPYFLYSQNVFIHMTLEVGFCDSEFHCAQTLRKQVKWIIHVLAFV